MNKEVIIKDGNVYVKDHLGEERNVSFVDNLDDVLIQENVVEIIEKVIYALEDSRTTFKKNKLRDISYIPAPIISTFTIPTLMMYLNTSSLEGMINTRFGLVDKQEFLTFFITAFTPYALRMSKTWYQEYKEDAKCEKGRLLALYHLKSNLVLQNERLKNLRNNSKEMTANEDKKYSLNEDAIDNLQDHINLYYELGYNIKEYYEYFRVNGHLPDEIKSEYKDDGVRIIEEYLRKNGPKIKKLGSK